MSKVPARAIFGILLATYLSAAQNRSPAAATSEVTGESK
jgi:hypothetical protein